MGLVSEFVPCAEVVVLFFSRKKNGNWYVRIVYPPALGGSVIQKSLNTRNELQAEIEASKYIIAYKYSLWIHEGKRDGSAIGPKMESMFHPGEERVIDNWRVMATDDGKELELYEGPKGKYAGTVPNPTVPRFILTLTKEQEVELHHFGAKAGPPAYWNPKDAVIHSKTATPNGLALDERMFERWDRVTTPTDKRRNMVRQTLTEFQTTIGAMSGANDDDVLAFLDHMVARKLSLRTRGAKMGFLSSIHKECSKQPWAPARNYFRGVVRKPRGVLREDAPMPGQREHSTDDCLTILRYVPNMKPEHRMLIQMCMMTGMRPREVLMIREEEVVHGIRVIVTGTKSFPRRIPLPEAFCRAVPRIEGPLFPDAPLWSINAMDAYADKTTTNCCYHLRKSGLQVNKALYRCRHRAKTIIRNSDMPQHLQQWLLGHDREKHEPTKIEDGYGDFPDPAFLVPYVELIASVVSEVVL